MEGGIGENMFEEFDQGSARYDEGKQAGMHSENLYDQDEDGAGETHDMRTGKKFDNSTYTGAEHLTEREGGDEASEDVLGSIGDGTADDDAARWLAENDK